jgi:MarR family transcriptional regulator, organic hydroperoxide resistance regulator
LTELDFPTLPDSLDGVDDLSSAAFRAFIGTLRLHRRLMMQVLADRGFHPGQVMCLRLLIDHEGITQRDLAKALYVAPPTVTKMLNSMERAGLVRRRPDAADARLTRVELTDAGRAAEKLMRSAAGEYVKATVGMLPENDRRELTRLLTALGATIERASAAREAAAPVDDQEAAR